jgi:hypothetical protein
MTILGALALAPFAPVGHAGAPPHLGPTTLDRSPLAVNPIDVYSGMHNQVVIETADSIAKIAAYNGDIYYVSNGVWPGATTDYPAMAMYQKSYDALNNTYGPKGYGKILGYQNARKYAYKGIIPASDGVFTAGLRQPTQSPTDAVLDVWEHDQNQLIPRHSLVLSTGANTEFTNVLRGPTASADDDYVFVTGGTLGAVLGLAGLPLGDEDFLVARFKYDAVNGFTGSADPNNYLQFGTSQFEELFTGVYDPDTNGLYVVGKTSGDLCAAYPTKAGLQCRDKSGLDAVIAGIGNEAGKLKLKWLLQFGSSGDDDLAKSVALYRNPADATDSRLFIAGATNRDFTVPNGAYLYENPATNNIHYQDAFLVSVALDASGNLAQGDPLQIVDVWGGDYGDIAGAVVITGDDVMVAGHHGGAEGHIDMCDRTEPSPGSDLQPNTPANNPFGTGNFASNDRIDLSTPYIYTYDAVTGARLAEHEILNPTNPAAPIGDTGEQIMGIALDSAGRIHVAGQVVHSGATLAFKGARGTGYNNDCSDGLLGVFTP